MFTEPSKKSCLRTTLGNQRVNRSQPLLKSARHHYYPIIQLIWEKFSSKMSPVVLSQIFRVLLNTLTPNDKYSRRNM